MIRTDKAIFTARLRSKVHPYIYITVPRDIQQLLDVKRGDYVIVHVKVIKRV